MRNVEPKVGAADGKAPGETLIPDLFSFISSPPLGCLSFRLPSLSPGSFVSYRRLLNPFLSFARRTAS